MEGREGLEELTGVKMLFDEGGDEFDGLSHLLGIVDWILRVRRILLARWHDSAIKVLALILVTLPQEWKEFSLFNSKSFNLQLMS